MAQVLEPEIKSLLEEVVLFLSQLGDPTVSKTLRTKAGDLKQKIEELCFGVQEELYDEATKEDDDAVPELPKARHEGISGAPANATSVKGLVKRKSASGSWHGDEQLIAEVAVSSLSNATKQGYLEKKRPENRLASIMNPYQKRYCAIHEGIFYYFDTATARKQSGAFHIKEYEARPAYHLIKSLTKKEGSFELVAPGQRSFQFLAKDFEEMKEWITAVDEWSDMKHPNVSTLAKPTDAIDKNSGSGSDTGSINISGGADITEEHTDADPSKRRSPLASKTHQAPPQEQLIYDDAEAEELYDEAGVEPAAPSKPDLEIYDEAGIEEETYDEAGEAPAPAPPVKPLPKLPPLGRRAVPQPPIPKEPQHRRLPSPPPSQVTVSASSEQYENMFYGLWNCEASVSHELSFNSGDIIHVVSREHEGSGWWTGLLNGKVGLVPKSFLTAAYVAV